MTRNELTSDLNYFKCVAREMIEQDLKVSNIIDAFHQRTHKDYYRPGEENQDVYTRILGLIDALSSDLGEAIAQDALEPYDI